MTTDQQDSTYTVAFADSNGDWDRVETFTATDDTAASDYAERKYAGDEWYVLNAAGENINGGNR
jgi:hypothetical protein